MAIGDVMLVRGLGKLSSLLLMAQKPFYSNTKSSHILMAIDQGVFIHAGTHRGVDVIYFEDLIENIDSDWRSVRLKGLTESQRIALRNNSFFYLQQEYSYKYLVKESQYSSFCSELVGKIFRRSHIDVFKGKEPSKIIPADFDKEADSGLTWMDVTDSVANSFEYMKSDSNKFRENYEAMALALILEQAKEEPDVRLYQGMVIETANGENISPYFYKKVRKFRQTISINRDITFWNNEGI